MVRALWALLTYTSSLGHHHLFKMAMRVIHLRRRRQDQEDGSPSSPPGSGAWAEAQGLLGVLSARPPLFFLEHSPGCAEAGGLVSVHASSLLIHPVHSCLPGALHAHGLPCLLPAPQSQQLWEPGISRLLLPEVKGRGRSWQRSSAHQPGVRLDISCRLEPGPP